MVMVPRAPYNAAAPSFALSSSSWLVAPEIPMAMASHESKGVLGGLKRPESGAASRSGSV